MIKRWFPHPHLFHRCWYAASMCVVTVNVWSPLCNF